MSEAKRVGWGNREYGCRPEWAREKRLPERATLILRFGDEPYNEGVSTWANIPVEIERELEAAIIQIIGNPDNL
jgi:hypothetical protein